MAENSFWSKIRQVFTASEIDDDFYDELEETLISADMGVMTTEEILDELKDRVKEDRIKTPDKCKQALIEAIRNRMKVASGSYGFEEQKSVVLVVGVNGVGKTTSIGKLAFQYKLRGKKVLLAAADTFRAGAIEQLGEWSKRAGVDMIAQKEGADPAAVVFDAVRAAKARNTDILICDTAGRLHNKKNLMQELGKIYRILEKEYTEAHIETLIVLDGTTGQNALVQAAEFRDTARVDGIILTKMDGTAKGGIAVAVENELRIPVKYIGTGEKISDMRRFDEEKYVNALFETE